MTEGGWGNVKSFLEQLHSDAAGLRNLVGAVEQTGKTLAGIGQQVEATAPFRALAALPVTTIRGIATESLRRFTSCK